MLPSCEVSAGRFVAQRFAEKCAKAADTIATIGTYRRERARNAADTRWRKTVAQIRTAKDKLLWIGRKVPAISAVRVGNRISLGLSGFGR
jgi:hypothetical protein